MIEHLLTFVSCAAIIFTVEPAMNRMTRRTPLALRLGSWLIVVAAFGAIVYLALGFNPPWPAVLGACGIALYLIGERRHHGRQRWIDRQRASHG